jgi:hypothetical protein
MTSRSIKFRVLPSIDSTSAAGQMKGTTTVNLVDLESSVPDCLIEHPELLALFQELGVDYSCGGKSLARACQERNLSIGEVLLRCERTIASRPPQ